MSPHELDHTLLLGMRTRGHAPAIERAVASYSKLAEHGAVWIGLGAVAGLIDRDGARRRAWLKGGRAVAGAYVANQVIKFTLRRRRPELPDLPPLTPTVSRLSFPSAHATTSFAGAFAYRRLAPPVPLYLAALAFGLSRPYLGVHYPSDVLAGSLLGTTIAAALLR